MIQKVNKVACNLVNDSGWEPVEAIDMFNSFVLRYGICRDNRLNPAFEAFLKNETRAPDSIVLAHDHFCEATYDPNGWDGIKVKVLRKQVKWLRAEFLCLWMRETVSPTGFWKQLFWPDLPFQKKYEERTDAICQKLKNGEITFDEANYRWKQEILEAQKHLSPETVKKMGQNLKQIIEPLLDLLTE